MAQIWKMVLWRNESGKETALRKDGVKEEKIQSSALTTLVTQVRVTLFTSWAVH